MGAEENVLWLGRVTKESVKEEEAVPTTPPKEPMSRSRPQVVEGSRPDLGAFSIHSTNSLMWNSELVCCLLPYRHSNQ